MQLTRPLPPQQNTHNFLPSENLTNWVYSAFIEENAPLYNPEYTHLLDATIGFLWAYIPKEKQGKRTLGTAEQFNPKGNTWQIERQKEQISNWFSFLFPDDQKVVEDLELKISFIPDFIITLDASFCSVCSDLEFCHLVEHELYHCAQKLDRFGYPAFNEQNGKPKFTIRDHDIELFITPAERYGLDALSSEVSELITKVKRQPIMTEENIRLACGSLVSHRT